MNPLPRSLTLLFILVLLACTPVSRSAAVPKPSDKNSAPKDAHLYQDNLSSAPSMQAQHAAHSATLLANGKVLIAGGFRAQGTQEIAITNAELYDPASKRFTPTGDMNEARSGHTATLLANGTVLLVGGWGPSQRRASAEIYDPQTGQFSMTASMVKPRAGMTATMLKDGRVLIVGGTSARNEWQAVAEIYDPNLGTFVLTGLLQNERSAHTATRLIDDRVLIVGGNGDHNGNGYQILNSAELYTPSTGEFAPTGELAMVRHKHAAVLLEDGNVLIIGGSNQDDWQGQYASTEIYNTLTGRFQLGVSLHNKRFKLADAVLLLTNGNVLVGGGNRQLEIFEMVSQRFVTSGELDDHYYYTVLTRLEDGSVLITGGYDSDIQPTAKAWIYR